MTGVTVVLQTTGCPEDRGMTGRLRDRPMDKSMAAVKFRESANRSVMAGAAAE
jgi:hypothetical protein